MNLRDIPKNRLILYIIILGFIPPLLVGIHLWTQKAALDQLQTKLEFVQHTALTKQTKQAINQAAHGKFKDADHFYIDKNLETQIFLHPEIKTLRNLTDNKNFAGDEQLTKRLEKLTGKENKLLFTGGQVHSYPSFQESTLTLAHPVEVNSQDIQKILAITEGIPIGKYQPGERQPQLIILDFKIDRKDVSGGNEVFLLNMKILKREYL